MKCTFNLRSLRRRAQATDAQMTCSGREGKMKIFKSRSVLPIYSVGLVWLAYALLFPLYRMADYAGAALISAVAYILVSYLVTALGINKYQNVDTGDSSTDEMIIGALKNVERMRLLRNSIQNEKARSAIQDLEQTAGLIIEHIRSNRDKASKVSQFFLYYLPTTVTLLERYKQMELPGQTGEHLRDGKQELEEFLDKLVEAYHSILDQLFGDHAMGISIDIDVLEQMLRQDNYLKG